MPCYAKNRESKKIIKKTLQNILNILFFLFSSFFLFYLSEAVGGTTSLRYQADMDCAKDVSKNFHEKNKLDTNLTADLKYKTLIWAADMGDVPLIEALLVNGAIADINKPSSNTIPILTPLMFAIYNNYPKAAEVLVKAGADVNKVEKSCEYETSLICSMSTSGCSIELLLDYGADPNYQDDRGMTATMHAAADFGVLQLEQLFQYKGKKVDVNKIEKRGKTALMFAAKANCSRCVEILLENGTQLDTQDNMEGNTALILAAQEFMTDGN